MQSSNKKKKLWIEEKERLLKMTLEERRKEYKDYVSLDKIPSLKEELKSKTSNNDETPEEMRVKSSLCEKVSLYKGDITQLEVDAIVNAANSSLLGGGGVDGCIHRASGPCLFAECRTLHGCRTGEAKITCGYELPAKYVIHTVGPIARGQLNETHKADLASCYQSSLKLAKEHQIRTIAFPCISTGIYGFPNEPAAVIALNKCKEWLKKNHDEMDRIIFCVFLDVDFKIYKKKLVDVFVKGDDTKDGGEEEDEDIKEGTEQMNEDTEGMTQKAQSPPIKKYKGKQPESLQDPPEDNQEEKDKVSAEEMKEETQEADEKNQSFPPITPEKEIGLPPEKSTDGSKDMIEEGGEEGLAGQEMPDKKITEGIA
ncbi:ADP-ribose glycohydrolase MACROD2 [Spea bombifrons]|uniref:ADP-ribose glycohydrolase MACROD2 n=1 Tax=Spea bombifrons TaxID=233779 RepID=UPI00234B7D82|nr:ADP-ribose glycohydrolase MACROD2 [Spea bombifrons]